ncbi:MAG: exo-alpha-sialidase [Planctomycetes bacterium]|nr:exo-alpha-sialidase [Planctomycetota bacterium]
MLAFQFHRVARAIWSSRSSLLAIALVSTAFSTSHAWAQDLRTNPPDVEDLPAALPPPAPTPGTDRCLGMTWEPTIAVDRRNPRIVAVAQSTTVQVSFDSGDNFTQTLNAIVPGPTPSDPGWCSGGDPSLGFDSQGRLFLTYLGTRLSSASGCAGCPAATGCNAGRDVFITGWNRVGNNFVQFIGPVNVTALSGHGAPHNADKEWLAVDSYPGSSLYTDRLYVAWSDIDQEPWQIWTTFSTDQGATWSVAQQISVPGQGRHVWPVHNTVAPNHDVYLAYHAQGGFFDGAPDYDVPDGVSGVVYVFRSTNGGGTYTKTATNPFDADGSSFSEADMTYNRQDKGLGVVPKASYWTLGCTQPWIMADPVVTGRLYVVCADDPDNDINAGDYADVVFSRSNDFGATWTTPTKIDDAPGTGFTFFPTAAIDPNEGAIVVTWFEARSGITGPSGDLLLDLRARASWDGGNSWLPSVKINDDTFDPGLSTNCRFCCTAGQCAPLAPQTLRIGEYNGVAFGECTAHMVWPDDATCGGGFSDIFYDRDPELGGDFTPPVIVCPPHTSVGCNASTHPQQTGFATATDNCDLNPSVSYVDLPVAGNCPPSTVISSIQRIWSSTDKAGNINTCVQNIAIVDFDAPVITVPPQLGLNSTVGYVNSSLAAVQAWANAATAVDACSAATLNFNLPPTFPGDVSPGITTNVIFSAADVCGNSDFALGAVRVVVPFGAGVRYCFGNGGGTACPCGNVGLPNHGCNTSEGTGGVALTAQNFAPNGGGGGTVNILATNFPPAAMVPGQLFSGTATVAGGAGVVFGDGLLCVGGTITRLGVAFSQNGATLFPVVHAGGAGARHYQLWFRNNPLAFCDPAAAYNMSNAVTLIW